MATFLIKGMIKDGETEKEVLNIEVDIDSNEGMALLSSMREFVVGHALRRHMQEESQGDFMPQR